MEGVYLISLIFQQGILKGLSSRAGNIANHIDRWERRFWSIGTFDTIRIHDSSNYCTSPNLKMRPFMYIDSNANRTLKNNANRGDRVQPKLFHSRMAKGRPYVPIRNWGIRLQPRRCNVKRRGKIVSPGVSVYNLSLIFQR